MELWIMIRLTHSYQLLPVGVTHMTVEILLAMIPCHGSSATCRVVKRAPQRFYNLASKHSGAPDEGRSVSCKALLNVSVNVKETYARDD